MAAMESSSRALAARCGPRAGWVPLRRSGPDCAWEYSPGAVSDLQGASGCFVQMWVQPRQTAVSRLGSGDPRFLRGASCALQEKEAKQNSPEGLLSSLPLLSCASRSP